VTLSEFGCSFIFHLVVDGGVVLYFFFFFLFPKVDRWLGMP